MNIDGYLQPCTSICLWLIISFHMILLVPSAAYTQKNNESDRLALLSFKDGITSDPLRVLSSWNKSLHFCEWPGVSCSKRHPRVTSIALQQLKLQGTLSPQLGNLSFLRLLNLENNQFHGRIPPELGRLFRLRDLWLGSNSMHGEIPLNITRCSQLRVLSLTDNFFSGIVAPELGSLSRLEVFGLSGNELIGTIPPSLGNLSFLVNFGVQDNIGMGGTIPPELGTLSRLQYMYLAFNSFEGMIPASFYNLTNLVLLQMCNNNLNGSLPPYLGLSFPFLQELNLRLNGLTGVIPISLVNASKLQVIALDLNFLQGEIPRELGKLGDLTIVSLGYNYLGRGKDHDDLLFLQSLSNCTKLTLLGVSVGNLGGSLSKSAGSLGNLSQHLSELYLGYNRIHGFIPPEISNLANLSRLGLESNLLYGVIPGEIGKLSALTGLNVYNNSLYGKIPSTLGNLTLLQALILQGNLFYGEIPPSIANCSSMRLLELSDNLLTGNFPRPVLQMYSLKTLRMQSNSFTGPMPAGIGALIQLEYLSVYNNNFSGNIPSELGGCVMLSTLNMSTNMFEGSIPETWSSLKILEVLDLSLNNLSGPVPQYLATLPNLVSLNFSFNHLEGVLPTEGVFSNISNFSIAGNEELCGGIRELFLKPCSITNNGSRSYHRHQSIKLIVVIPSTTGLALFIVVSFLVWRKKWIRKTPSKPESNSFPTDLRQVSYAEIVRATENFSSSNLIGSGSFGSVYKGYLNSYERVVAIKVLNLQYRRAFKSFTAECDALKNIRHRNLIKILTSCSSIDFQGTDFKALIYEFMVNGDLEMWLHNQEQSNDAGNSSALSFAQRLDIALDVALALDYLHNDGDTEVVHCDIKPSNVLLDEDMVAHLGDFGMAKILGINASNVDSSGGQSTITLKGTIGYIPPEYGDGGEVTSMGDVYSYGVLLLETFTGKRPTHEMFTSDLNLPTYARMAFPNEVVGILDQQMMLHCIDNEEQLRKIQQVSTLVIHIGIECSTTSPKDRITMQQACQKLLAAKELLHGIRNRE